MYACTFNANFQQNHVDYDEEGEERSQALQAHAFPTI